MLYAFIILFIVAFLFIGIIRKYAPTLGLMDVPNERSIHNAPTARGAGISFYSSLLCVIPFFYLDLLSSYIWTFSAVLLIFMIGIRDDYAPVSPKMKFLVIILSTVLLSFDGIIITHIGTFFSMNITLGWFALPFTIFVVSGFTNALNLIDGLDGLSSTISVVILTAFYGIGFIHNDLFMMLVSGSFITILLAFLVYNWHPASIFMGDSGSLTLGFVISVLAIKSLAYIPAVSILYLGAIPILDTLVVMIRRKRAGRSFFSADSCHMHHIIKEHFSGNTPRTVLFLGFMQVVYVCIGLQFAKGEEQGIFLVLFIVNILFLYRFFERMIQKQKKEC